jgi:hypothetical protein
MRSRDEVVTVLEMLDRGMNDCDIARQTGIPRSTVRDWRHGKNRVQNPRRLYGDLECQVDHPSLLPPIEYSYLLGQYLGDGYLSQSGRARYSWLLRIFSDAKYPGIIGECAGAMEAIFPGKRARLVPHGGCVAVSMTSSHWTCLFPQHGPGRKHCRPIKIADWQREIVGPHPGSLLRGLIHSDGCRCIARECQQGRVRYAPRYVFTNLSEDIKDIFCAACDAADIHWTRPNGRSIAIYRLASVARMDEFVGPKA